MRTFIYKRTHSGDPDPATGEFGNHDCMGSCRSWSFDAVIGVGGTGSEPVSCGIARKLTWVGVGPHKTGDSRRPLVTFDHFLYYGEKGPLLEEVAKNLARHFYKGGVRTLVNLTSEESREVDGILASAMTAPPSPMRCGCKSPCEPTVKGRCCRG